MEKDKNSKLPKGTMLHGVYRIEKYLSSGGFGNTYIAKNVAFDERVAIKEFFMKGVSERDDDNISVSVSNSGNVKLFASQLSKFKREAKRLRHLSNPHIVAVYDLFEANGTAYYVMEYVDGLSLDQQLSKNGKPFPSKFLMSNLLPQILDALKTVHSNELWHLDIKPSNIMMDGSGKLKLIDFGASKHVDAETGDLSTTTSLAYTPGYAPIELQEYVKSKIGAWTDLYSLGATLYNLATCASPPKFSEIFSDGINAFHFLPDTDSDFKKLVSYLMNTNVNKRPQSVTDVLKFISEENRYVDVDDNGDEPIPIGIPTKISSSQNQKNIAKNNNSYVGLIWFVLMGVVIVFIFILSKNKTPSNQSGTQLSGSSSVLTTTETNDPNIEKLKGTIGPYSITMFINPRNDVGEIAGYYYYNNKPNNKFKLKVVQSEAINIHGSMKYVLYEYTKSGKHSGTFDGQYECQGDYFAGTFTNSDGEQYNFELQ